jgi:hypothetical protein
MLHPWATNRMTTKILTGTYAAGYSLSASYSGLVVSASARVTGVTGTVGQSSTVQGGSGGGEASPGLSATAFTSVTSSGIVLGGQGGAGGDGVSYGGYGGYGGVGLDLKDGGSVTVTAGTIAGGRGGTGGAGRIPSASGGEGGQGGSGIFLTGGGSIAVSGGAIVGGQGGAGGYGYGYSRGGPGGIGARLSGPGSFTLAAGTIAGGEGGPAGSVGARGRGYAGFAGDGIDLSGGSPGDTTFTNLGVVQGGAEAGGGLYASIGIQAANATIFNGSGSDHAAAISASSGVSVYETTLTNYGTIKGLRHAGVSTDQTVPSSDRVTNGSATDQTALIYGRTSGVFIGLYHIYEAQHATVTNFGTIAAAPGYDSVRFANGAQSRLIVEAGSQFIGAVVGDQTDTLELAGGTGTISRIGNWATLSGSTAATVRYFGAYVVDAGGRWALTGADSVLANDSLTIAASAALTMKGATVTNAGRIEVASAGQLVVFGTTIANNGGTISVAAGSKMSLEGGDVMGGVLTTTGTGIIEATGAVSHLNGLTNKGRVLVYSGTTLSVAGFIIGTGQIILPAATNNTEIQVAPSGVTFSGRGVIELGDSANDLVIGASASATLTNVDDKIEGGGRLGGGQMTLVNQAGGMIEGIGAIGLTIDTGANTIVNAGLIWAAGHAITVDSAIASNGKLYAMRGVLTLAGAVSGTGSAYINGGTLIAEGAFSQTVIFNGPTGVLELGQSQAYGGQIVGFSTSGKTTLDLLDIAFTGSGEASFSGAANRGVLTVTDGTHTAHITLAGDFTASTFLAASDGHGGVAVTASATQVFAQAIAGVGGAAATQAPLTDSALAGVPPLLSRPG